MNELFGSAVLDVINPVEIASSLFLIFLIPMLVIVLIAIVIIFAIVMRSRARKRDAAAQVLGQNAGPAVTKQAEDNSDKKDPTEDELE